MGKAKTSVVIPRRLHPPSGRPFVFELQRDWAEEYGHKHLFKEIDLALEQWHRPPEEWELARVEPFHDGPVRISYAVLQALAHAGPAQWPYIGGQRINPSAILRCRSWPDMVAFFGALQVDVAHLPDRAEYEFRPTSQTLARNNAAHFPTYDPGSDHQRHLGEHRRMLAGLPRGR